MERHANCRRTIGICIEYGFQFGVLHFETIITCLNGYQNNKGYRNRDGWLKK